ncbi:MAG TPA: orotidine 5'-phosphate decarboxylase / HUMPS family protein [Candidatus Saccharimonadaceae bacterium]|nr:orotidine 5'-phosphate decarboxylase / HUMPS family protein [Candidatus Saccharimonadaceae bacterium]
MSALAIAFDVATLDEALALDRALGEGPELAKVGLQLFTAAGPGGVRRLRERGRRVFLDLKLHDIPNTVAGAAREAGRLGVDLLTVHAAGGAAMIRAAAEAAAEGSAQGGAHAGTGPGPGAGGTGIGGTGVAGVAGGSGTGVVAVTLLTSLDPGDLPPGFQRPFDLAGTLAGLLEMSLAAGARGIVCSAADLPGLKARHPQPFFAVTPGIRMAGGERHDQARVATIGEAVRLGAGLLVLGRAVTGAADPRLALAAARAERDQALAAIGT